MQCWGLTDPGCVRKQNQDAYRIERLDRNNLLCVVCDGMGGAKSGNIASTLAVEVFVEEIRRCWKPGMDAEKTDQMLRSAVKLANFTVFDQAAQFEEFDGMGTTLVAVLIQGKKATVVNVGDSRAYLMRSGAISRVTKDHTLVEEMVSQGLITEREARVHPRRNLVTRALGTSESVEVDLIQLDVRPGEVILICSDGLSNYVPEHDLLRVTTGEGEWQEKLRELVGIALNAGGSDNITAMLATFEEESR